MGICILTVLNIFYIHKNTNGILIVDPTFNFFVCSFLIRKSHMQKRRTCKISLYKWFTSDKRIRIINVNLIKILFQWAFLCCTAFHIVKNLSWFGMPSIFQNCSKYFHIVKEYSIKTVHNNVAWPIYQYEGHETVFIRLLFCYTLIFNNIL